MSTPPPPVDLRTGKIGAEATTPRTNRACVIDSLMESDGCGSRERRGAGACRQRAVIDFRPPADEVARTYSPSRSGGVKARPRFMQVISATKSARARALDERVDRDALLRAALDLAEGLLDPPRRR
jgi:hypothetical protein